ncbi:KilA-N domain-containing protein [Desulfonema magnum]|uniref:DNA-binding domain-containing protein, KilA-N-like n=1 Tax=Desulfonema magnum TaxID=45655 RepID=A0A975GLU5_9BACT|nr:KilA-N domain-containing protein [Desulfonema magnum]QTA86216.1 DNA-binding domain-containing protein, KilA-N-like [Desulfonema magnum]
MIKKALPQTGNKNQALSFDGVDIREDHDNEMISLTDLWKAAGGDKNRAPAQWLKLPGTKAFIKALEKQIVKISHSLLKSRGRLGTFAHWQIALAYAKYLSPELHLHVNEVYMRYRTGDITLADEILEKASTENQEWLAQKALSTVHRNKLTGTLKKHGVHGPFNFAKCTNNTYRGLYNRTARQLKADKNLPAKVNLREHMDTDELITVGFTEMVTRKDIEKRDVQGNTPCANSCLKMAKKVSTML